MARGRNCAAHKHFQLVPIEWHHIHPLGYHGPDTKENQVPLCCNAHSDTHYLLEALLRTKATSLRVAKAELERGLLTTFGLAERRYASQGFVQVMAYAEMMAVTARDAKMRKEGAL